ncbi:MAG: MBL fold metallo-hydrolase, partial [Pedobacter sp.]|nr:MBL fold metallo-hydrolase [Pedobacter sp.]
TLFIGDVGRPDLAQSSVKDLTQDKLAGYLFDSLRNKIMPLNDDIIVYPAHGAGSACGKNMSKETTDTLGNQKKTNYALRQDMTKEVFIEEVNEGLLPPPAYFPLNVKMNKEGYEPIDTVLERGNKALNPTEFERMANQTGAIILDTRTPQTFAAGFVPNAVNIGIDGSFAPWVGTLIPDIMHQILLVTDEGREEESITRLARVGYDYTIGFLDGGLKAWEKAGKDIDHIESISPAELEKRINKGGVNLVDVRKETEFGTEHAEGAKNMPLDYVNEQMTNLNKDETYYVHCAGGYRSMVFNSILRARGFRNLIDIQGGFKAIKENGNISTVANS